MPAMQMAPITETLGSQKQLALLNDIDKLRSHGISQFVNLPQLIVCGDQSSGKSSVLEAISGLQFPTKDNLCTRFATEVILRHAPEARVAVKIVAGPERSKDEQAKLDSFRRDLVNLEDFPALIDDAKSYMGVADGPSAFSTDVLRLEISGPKQPHLTIVDLPGLIHSENKSQTAADIRIVQAMVHEYMTNQRSIILAVISAKNDFANQIVLSMARKVDQPGTRTMGVITKPDTLSAGSESELAYLNLARNLDVNFRLGWHVLKNRSYETRESSSAERDEAERSFLSQGVWKDLSRQSVGIHALRDKLSHVLLNHIRAELPRLIADIKGKLDDCKSALDRLGPNRDSFDQQRLFLLQISQEFQAVSKAALDGSYGHGFFGDPRSSEGYTKRLRAVVQNLNKDFAETVRLHGQKRRIVDHQTKTSSPQLDAKTVSRADFIDEIKELLSVTRGRELPGMFNPLIVGDLFFEQSRPWEQLARQHLRDTWQATKSFLELLVSHLADEKTSEALLGHVIDTVMDQKLNMMNEKLSELLTPYQKGHPITYNHYFTENIQKTKEKRREAEIERRLRRYLGQKEDAAGEYANLKNAKMPGLLSALSSSTEADMDRYACSEILDCMEAFYKVAMKTFVDNVTVFSVECCLLSDLSAVLSPSSVLQMDQQLVCEIASESQLDHLQREENQKRLGVLQAGLDICNAHVERKPSNRKKLSKLSNDRPPAPIKLPATDEADDLSEEGELEVSSLVGLRESLKISSDLQLVSSSEDSDNSRPREEPPPVEEAQPTKELPRAEDARPVESSFNFGKPTDDWGRWHFGYNAASSSSPKPPAPLTFEEDVPTSSLPPPVPPIFEEEAPVLKSASKKDKKSTKKGKKGHKADDSKETGVFW